MHPPPLLPPSLTAPEPPTHPPYLLLQGTFYSQEYAYLSFKFAVNKTHPRFADSSIYTGGWRGLVGEAWVSCRACRTSNRQPCSCTSCMPHMPPAPTHPRHAVTQPLTHTLISPNPHLTHMHHPCRRGAAVPVLPLHQHQQPAQRHLPLAGGGGVLASCGAGARSQGQLGGQPQSEAGASGWHAAPQATCRHVPTLHPQVVHDQSASGQARWKRVYRHQALFSSRSYPKHLFSHAIIPPCPTRTPLDPPARIGALPRPHPLACPTSTSWAPPPGSSPPRAQLQHGRLR